MSVKSSRKRVVVLSTLLVPFSCGLLVPFSCGLLVSFSCGLLTTGGGVVCGGLVVTLCVWWNPLREVMVFTGMLPTYVQ